MRQSNERTRNWFVGVLVSNNAFNTTAWQLWSNAEKRSAIESEYEEESEFGFQSAPVELGKGVRYHGKSGADSFCVREILCVIHQWNVILFTSTPKDGGTWNFHALNNNNDE
jgi:hypothetical protein